MKTIIKTLLVAVTVLFSVNVAAKNKATGWYQIRQQYR